MAIVKKLSFFTNQFWEVNSPTMSAEMGNKIMHVSLPVSKETMLMGSDTGGEWAPSFVQGNNFSISINAETKEEADRLFYGLSNDGKVTMPLDNTFWGDYFGMWTDKFGVNWMVSFNTNQNK
jgi:PhnB protein